MDLCIFGMQTNAELVHTIVELLKTDMTTLKEIFVALKTEFKQEMAATPLNTILQSLGVNDIKSLIGVWTIFQSFFRSKHVWSNMEIIEPKDEETHNCSRKQKS